MQIVIDIPEEVYIKAQETIDEICDSVWLAIKNGIPLPKGDKDCKMCRHSEETDGSNCYECVKGLQDNFEADKGEEE